MSLVGVIFARRWAQPAWRGLAWLLCVALVVLQSLGVWHGVAHGKRLYAGAATSLSQVIDQTTDQASDGDHVHATDHAVPSFLERIFSSHHSAHDCQSFDQLCHGDALVGGAALALPLEVPPFLLQQQQQGLAKARWHALFQARGPP